ncbi:hypothetical protein [Nitrosopumilus sp.]|uniref:hypothetical protein n=1 Tax=Nitrosopumilus sp. TaxID=2024843 RepID=UPI0029306BDC|nr:hypothetical protein [Nitrosopumilus sp.]
MKVMSDLECINRTIRIVERSSDDQIRCFVRGVEVKIEYLAAILHLDITDKRTVREVLGIVLHVYRTWFRAMSNPNIRIHEGCINSLTWIAGKDNLVDIVRFMDLSNSVAREIIIKANGWQES